MPPVQTNSSTNMTSHPAATTTHAARQGLFESRRGRILLENLTAYLFLLPAGLIIFIFGIFPVAFAFFVSLHRWRRFPDGWRGLDSYVRALGDLAYVLFFWLALGALIYGLYLLWKTFSTRIEQPNTRWLLLSGFGLAAGIGGFIHWFFALLPVVLEVPVRLRGQAVTQDIFVAEFFNSFTFPQVLAASNGLLVLVIAIVIAVITLGTLRTSPQATNMLARGTIIGFALLAGTWLLIVTVRDIQAAIDAAREAGEALPIWSQVIFISAGTALIGAAIMLWQRSVHNHHTQRFPLRAMVVVFAVVGAVFLIQYLPLALAEADDDVLRGFNVTVMYSAFSVPLQLALGMLLAVLLFQNVRGKSFFRVVFFMPYITPVVATSVVFGLIFSHGANSPVNQLMTTLGIETQNWLREPRGIFTLMFGEGVPEFLAGPGLALVVIILFNVWMYAGYSAVIFLAGLGNISQEVYEAARIDGANGWQQFRHITLPLLSPTTFFLMLIATIGTFQAFTQIFLMRRPGAFDAVDTINLHIFDEITRDSPNYAYGTAMAFVLFAVILVLTLTQNRIAGRRVFYG